MEGADYISLLHKICVKDDEKMLLEDFFAGFDVYPHL